MKRIKKPGVKKESPKYLKAKKLRKDIKKVHTKKGTFFMLIIAASRTFNTVSVNVLKMRGHCFESAYQTKKVVSLSLTYEFKLKS